MSVIAPFAYASGGDFYVCGDGPELFCYGTDDKPRWKQFCEGILVGVGASHGTVHALDDQGGYTLWNPLTGQRIGQSALEVACRGMAVSESGLAAILSDEGAALISRDGQIRPLSAPAGTSIAFSADGQRVAIGTASGDLLLFDAGSGVQIAGTNVGAGIAALAWASPNEWIVAAGSQLIVVAGQVQLQPPGEGMAAPSAIRRSVKVEGAPTRLAVNTDGVLLACDDGAQTVYVYETHQYKCGGTVVYQREIGALDFGPATLLGIGLEYADANRVEVLSGVTARSLPGLGRGSTPWFPRVKLDQYILRGAVATKRAGGMPIANVRQEESRDMNRTLMFGGIAAVAVMLCCGMSGTMLVLWRVLM